MGVEDLFHGIEANQRHTYYTLQIKITHQTEHGAPDGPLLPIEQLKDGVGHPRTSNWGMLSWDHFCSKVEPWDGSGNAYKPVYKESHDEINDVWRVTGRHGWWTYAFAKAGARRFRTASDKRLLKYEDGHGRVVSRTMYDVRIVRVTVAKVVEVVDNDDVPCGV